MNNNNFYIIPLLHKQKIAFSDPELNKIMIDILYRDVTARKKIEIIID